MKTQPIFIVSISLALLGGTPLLAQMGPFGQPQTRANVEANVKERFSKVDLNKDGFVTPEEMKSAVQGRRDDMRAKHFDMMDANKDGSISRDEFNAAHQGRGPRGGMRGGGDSSHMLQAVDANKDGKVSQAEMLSAALARFDAADANKDGTVTFDERRSAMMKKRMERMQAK